MGLNREWLPMFAIIAVVLQADADVHSRLASTTTEITDLCPYSDFCSHNTSLRIDDPDLQPCCLPCSCSPDCASIRNCCPDAAKIAMPTHVYPCRDQSQIYSEYLNITNWNYISTNLYRIVDGCPEEAFFDPALTESVAHCYSASEIEDLVFVASLTSGLTYLNKHCAICNGYSDYVRWTLYLVHDYISVGESYEERDRNILTHGGVVSVPPSPSVAMTAICHDGDYGHYTRCNQSNTWDVYDEEINRKCATSVTLPEFVDFTGLADIVYTYVNIYCFICNNPRGTAIPSVCKDISIDPLAERSLLDVPFSALLVLRPQEPDSPTMCLSGEWFDPFRKICTALLCPDGSFARNGECIRLVEDVIGYQMAVYMDIEILIGLDLTQIGTNKFFNSMADFILEHFNVDTHRCGLCHIELTERTPDSLIMKASLLSSDSCSVDCMLRGFGELFPTQSVEAHLERNVTLLLLNVTNITPIPLYHVVAHRYHMNCFENNVFLFNETITCPSIELDPDELRYFEDHGRAVDMVAAQSRNVGDGTLRICTEEYVSILKTTGLVSGTEGLTCLLLLVVLAILASPSSWW